MGTFSRIRYVIAANMNSLLEKAEDPEKLLRALIREMEDAGEDARMAVADLLAEQSHLERRALRMEAELIEWQDRAEQAVAAERDDLARAALKAKTELAEAIEASDFERTDLAQRVAQLETDMITLKAKLGEAKLKLKEIHTRQRAPSAPAARKEDRLSHNERKIRSAMGRFDRLQNQVERLEARVRSYEVGGTAPTPWQSDELAENPMVEAELAELKERLSGKPQSKPQNKTSDKSGKGTSNPEPEVTKAAAAKEEA